MSTGLLPVRFPRAFALALLCVLVAARDSRGQAPGSSASVDLTGGEAAVISNAWDAGGTTQFFTQTVNGRSDVGLGAISTSGQRMTLSNTIVPYKLKGNDPANDYWLLSGIETHGVQGNPGNPADNWVSVGYYASDMNLELKCLNGTLQDYGPLSTQGQNTTGWTVGGSLSASVDSSKGPSGGRVSRRLTAPRTRRRAWIPGPPPARATWSGRSSCRA
jgi:hypothetical protein